jgi:hypothetical protein
VTSKEVRRFGQARRSFTQKIEESAAAAIKSQAILRFETRKVTFFGVPDENLT